MSIRPATASISQPSPILAGVNFIDGAPRNTKCTAYFRLRQLALQLPNVPNVGFGEFAAAVPFSSVRGEVRDSVHLVLAACRPSQMLRAYTASVPATVSRVVLHRRRWPVDGRANEAVSEMHSSILNNMAVAAGSRAERPRQAGVPRKSNGFIKKLLRFSERGSARKRIAVSLPSEQMGVAKSVASMRLAAAVDGTYSWGSHNETFLSLSVRARSVLVTLGGLVFSTQNLRTKQ